MGMFPRAPAWDATSMRTARSASPVLSEYIPNPFRRSTSVLYRLPEPAVVSLHVFAVGGRAVATLVDDEPRAAGEHSVAWNVGTWPGGLYC